MERVVVTGMGVVAPNAGNLREFEIALRTTVSGITFRPELAELKLGCQVAGVPASVDERLQCYLPEPEHKGLNSCLSWAAAAVLECWIDAGFAVQPFQSNREVDWNTGAIIGTGIGGSLETGANTVIPLVNSGEYRRIGSTGVERMMNSGVSALASALLALGGPVTTNSSACATGAEAILLGAEHIRGGRATRMLAGGAEGFSPYVCGGFDSMRVLTRKANAEPHRASRPLSRTAAGFVPGAGAAVLLLESLSSATARRARIYAEFLGGHANCGGHSCGGSMTASNPEGVRRCLNAAMRDAGVDRSDVDLVNGHFTGTGADVPSALLLQETLCADRENLPYFTATKGLIGHTLGAAGAIETVAAILQLYHGFIHANVNCEDLDARLDHLTDRIPLATMERQSGIVMKTSFGFGDVNCCLILSALR
jgi:3-oxoacyl-(acyl-carrier-protein) synthase